MNYVPELGQACFGQPTEAYALPDWVESMFDGIMCEVERVAWNVNQREFCDSEPCDFGPVHFRPYSWDDEADAGPNFWHDDSSIRIRWYKHPGRGMSCNEQPSPSDWIKWHDAVMVAIRQVDDERRTTDRENDVG